MIAYRSTTAVASPCGSRCDVARWSLRRSSRRPLHAAGIVPEDAAVDRVDHRAADRVNYTTVMNSCSRDRGGARHAHATARDEGSGVRDDVRPACGKRRACSGGRTVTFAFGAARRSSTRPRALLGGRNFRGDRNARTRGGDRLLARGPTTKVDASPVVAKIGAPGGWSSRGERARSRARLPRVPLRGEERAQRRGVDEAGVEQVDDDRGRRHGAE